MAIFRFFRFNPFFVLLAFTALVIAGIYEVILGR
jgi:hypothetical protein